MPSSSSNRSLAFSMVALAGGMLLLSFAAVPLYDLFCKVTGFGGTTQTAGELPTEVLDREITITFNADTDPNLPWRFTPVQKDMTVRIGAMSLAAYRAENLSHDPTVGMATYNVTPFEAGKYFHKIQCFCFEQQTLPADSVVNMPVSFYIDPEFDADPHLKGVKQITLSYTFFSELSKN